MGSDVSQRSSRSPAGRRFRSVRFKIILLVIVPIVSLTTLWAFAADVTVGAGLNLRHVNAIKEHLGDPAGSLSSALQDERRLSLVFLGARSNTDRAALQSGRLATDRQAALFRRLSADKYTQKVISPQARALTGQVVGYLNDLPARRKALDAGQVSRAEALTNYSGVITTINHLQFSLTTLSNPDVARDAHTRIAMARAREVLSEEDALLAGALAAGRLTFAEHVAFTKLVGTRRNLYTDLQPDLTPADRAGYGRITSSPEYHRLQALEDRFTDHMPAAGPKGKKTAMGMPRAATPRMGGMPVDAPLTADTSAEWKTAASPVLTNLRDLEKASAAAAAKRAQPIADGIIWRVVLLGALGLVAVIASLILTLWVGRSVIHALTGLRRAVLEFADERLPGVLRRLRRGEDVDVAAEAPPLSFSTREIDEVGQAFNAVRDTAIQSAVEEAALRRGINEVFLNLARRSQTLLHRQLSLLDTMERRVSEPDELDDLFRLDHLATRMRRHAEGLIILSGQAPGRGWSNPVPAIDVARAAAAEVEDYARVTVAAMPRVAIAGAAVTDLIHLLAELIENATLYSAPDTTVQVTGQSVAHGFAIEVEDRGLSMDPAMLAQINEKLAQPPDFDLSNSTRLGLFVVGRLAQRHSIQVTLRTSPYGGTTAIVLLPDQIVVRSGDQAMLSSGLDSGRLAATRRGEEAMVPVGTISPPRHGGRGNDTGPMPLTAGNRSPLPAGDHPRLPQRHDGTVPVAYDTSPAGDDAYDAGGHDDTGPFRTPAYDTGPNQYQRGPRGAGHDPGPYETSAFAPGRQEPDPGRFGGYDTGHDGGGPGQLGYGLTGPDTGQWTLPSVDQPGDRPRLPRRHAQSVAHDLATDTAGQASEERASEEQASGEQISGTQISGTQISGERPPEEPVSAPAPAPRRSLFDPVDEPSAGTDTPADPDTDPAPESVPEAPGGKPALPRRVRQASLAPQLREEVEPVSDTASGERSPEELRTMLSSIQKGWLRGRSEVDDATGREEEDI